MIGSDRNLVRRYAASYTGIVIAAALAGCGGGSAREESDPAAKSADPTSVERRREILERERPPSPPQRAPQPEPSRAIEAPEPLILLFKEDLSRRALVKLDAITVANATEEQWPDGSLGCGRPGEMYTQAIVPGYRVVLTAAGQSYAYHSDRRGRFIVCTSTGPASPVTDQTKNIPPAR